jgi:hypothetical protein
MITVHINEKFYGPLGFDYQLIVLILKRQQDNNRVLCVVFRQKLSCTFLPYRCMTVVFDSHELFPEYIELYVTLREYPITLHQ